MGTVLVTGAAGFIGSFVCQRLLSSTHEKVVGLDNLNAYYDVGLKKDRLSMVERDAGAGRFVFVKADVASAEDVEKLFTEFAPDTVVHLAAQAGVRYSIDHPHSYIESNLVGFFNILEACRSHDVGHLVYASSSSVYGKSTKVPYSVDDMADSPVSLYAATKKSNELMAHSYASLYGFATTGLRFFTVYGPMGRPDMAYFKFTERIISGSPIEIYNYGDLRRDFTYIDDIVTGVVNVALRDVPQESATGSARIYNIGNSRPVALLDFVDTLENVLLEEGVIHARAERTLLPMQPGDVFQTYADVSSLERDYDFKPTTRLEDGLREFARWYKEYRPRSQ
jgi:nucleoside-diphosphate-sugar epimerase